MTNFYQSPIIGDVSENWEKGIPPINQGGLDPGTSYAAQHYPEQTYGSNNFLTNVKNNNWIFIAVLICLFFILKR